MRRREFIGGAGAAALGVTLTQPSLARACSIVGDAPPPRHVRVSEVGAPLALASTLDRRFGRGSWRRVKDRFSFDLQALYDHESVVPIAVRWAATPRSLHRCVELVVFALERVRFSVRDRPSRNVEIVRELLSIESRDGVEPDLRAYIRAFSSPLRLVVAATWESTKGRRQTWVEEASVQPKVQICGEFPIFHERTAGTPGGIP